MTEKEVFLRLVNGSLDPATGGYVPSDENAQFSGKRMWYAYDRNASCEWWFGWLNRFHGLDKVAVRDFLNQCACPEKKPRLLVVVTNDLAVQEIFQVMLESMFSNLVPLVETAVSSQIHYKQFRPNTKRIISQLHGYPASMDDAIKFRNALKLSKTRPILFAKDSPPTHMPPHSIANFYTEDPRCKDSRLLEEFMEERSGILNWALKKPVRRLNQPGVWPDAKAMAIPGYGPEEDSEEDD